MMTDTLEAILFSLAPPDSLSSQTEKLLKEQFLLF